MVLTVSRKPFSHNKVLAFYRLKDDTLTWTKRLEWLEEGKNIKILSSPAFTNYI